MSTVDSFGAKGVLNVNGADYEIYRLNKAKMLPGYDLIVVARVRAVETDYQKLDRTYLRLLEQLDLLREDPS